MDKVDALIQAIKDEALNLGCSGTHEAEFVSDMLDRIVRRMDHLLTTVDGRLNELVA